MCTEINEFDYNQWISDGFFTKMMTTMKTKSEGKIMINWINPFNKAENIQSEAALFWYPNVR